MKKIILGMALALGLATPALATVNDPSLPPEGVNIMVVSVGQLYNGDTVKMTASSGKNITVHLSQCDVNWNTGDAFYLIASPSGQVVTTSVNDFQIVYRAAGKDWDTTIAYLVKIHKICQVQAD